MLPAVHSRRVACHAIAAESFNATAMFEDAVRSISGNNDYKFGDLTRGVLASVGGGRAGAVAAAARDAAAAERDAGRASEKLVREHLDEYLAGARGRAARDARGDAASEPYEPTYEAWVACLHPENAHEDGRIDERFYHEQSDHRRLWNAAAPPGSARRVAGIALADMPSQAAESLECI